MKLLVVLICVVTILLIGCKNNSILNGKISIVTKSGRHLPLADIEIVAIAEKDLAPFIEVKKTALALAAVLHRRRNEFDIAQRSYYTANENYSSAIDRFIFANSKYASAIDSGTDEERSSTKYDSNVAERNASEAGVIKRNRAIIMNTTRVELYAWPTANFFFKDIPLDITVKTISNQDGSFKLKLTKGRYAIAAHSKQLNEIIEYYWFCWIDVESTATSIVLNNSNLMETNSADSIMKVGLTQ